MSTDAADEVAFVKEVAREATASNANFALFFYSGSLFKENSLAAAVSKYAPKLRHAGCSTAGEITPAGLQEGHALALLFPRDRFTAVSSMVERISSNGMEDISTSVMALRQRLADAAGPDRSKAFALCFIDGMSYAEEAVTAAIHWELDDIPLIGGSSGDDLKFQTTSLICDGHVADDAAIVVLIATDVPFHVFKTDNFIATESKLVVTASDPTHRIVHEFNAAPAAEEYANAVGLLANDLTPLSFASYPTVVRVGGEYFCRSIQKTNGDGSLSFFCAIDDGIVLSIARAVDMVESTEDALREVDEKLGGTDLVLGFDCVLRRLDAVNRQVVRGLSEVYRKNHVIGFGTYGEQYRSMHLNQTFTGIAFGHMPAAE